MTCCGKPIKPTTVFCTEKKAPCDPIIEIMKRRNSLHVALMLLSSLVRFLFFFFCFCFERERENQNRTLKGKYYIWIFMFWIFGEKIGFCALGVGNGRRPFHSLCVFDERQKRTKFFGTSKHCLLYIWPLLVHSVFSIRCDISALEYTSEAIKLFHFQNHSFCIHSAAQRSTTWKLCEWDEINWFVRSFKLIIKM